MGVIIIGGGMTWYQSLEMVLSSREITRPTAIQQQQPQPWPQQQHLDLQLQLLKV